jgi:hypothetical protein
VGYFTAETRVRSQSIPFEFVEGEVVKGQDFLSQTLAAPILLMLYNRNGVQCRSTAPLVHFMSIPDFIMTNLRDRFSVCTQVRSVVLTDTCQRATGR